MATGAPTIRTGLSVFQPLSFAKSRDGKLIGTNGLNRGLFWNGVTSATEELGLDPPSAAPTVTASGSGNGASTGIYQCAYRYARADSPAIYSSISALREVSATSGNKFTWTVAFLTSDTGQRDREDMVQLYRSTADQAITLYWVVDLGRTGSITSSTITATFAVYTVPAGHNIQVGAIFTVADSDVGGYNTAGQTVTAKTATTITTDLAPGAIGNGTGGTWTLTGFSSDTASDDTLITQEDLRILNPDGSLNARRQEAPPNHKPFVAMFQDRMWYAGWIPYTGASGSTVNTSGTTVTASAASFQEELVGRYIVIDSDTSPRLISTYTDTTHVELASTPGTLSTKSYAIVPPFEERNTIYFSSQDEPESVLSTDVVTVQENTGDDDLITGLMPDSNYLYILKDRHIYRLGYAVQPLIDGAITLVAKRGCVNNRCWCRLDNTSFLMDQQGIYAFQAGATVDISVPIQSLFQDGTLEPDGTSRRIDWSKSKWFWAIADPTQQAVRFFVTYTADSSTRPTRWLEFNLTTKAWQTGSNVQELGGGCLCTISGRTRVLVGGEGEQVYNFGEGVYDHASYSSTLGAATAATSTTLTDSGAAFTAAMVGAPLVVLSGTGKAQIRKITAQTSTQLTVAAWTTTPAVGDTYFVGGIQWSAKTGQLQIPATDKQEQREVRLLYVPTTNAASLDIRRYLNFSTTVATNERLSDAGVGITTTADSSDVVVDLKSTRSSLGNSPGFARVPYSGRLQDSNQSARQLSFELRGMQTADPIEIQAIEIRGVET